MSVQNVYPIIKINPFRGEEVNADFEKWAKISSKDLLASGIITEQQRCRIILTYMEGRAALAKEAYYAELDKDTPIIKELETVKYLIKHFKPLFEHPNAEISLRQRLLDLKQEGSLEEYIMAEEALVGSANIGDDFERSFFFINGLKKPILKAVLEKNPRNFTQSKEYALSFVTKSETMVAMVKNPEILPKTIKSEEDDDRMDVDTIRARLQAHSEEIAALSVRNYNSYRPKVVFAAPTNKRAPIDINSKAGKSYFISNGLCFNCGNPGHAAKNCSGKES
ncbi:hypothetical protein BB558_006332, partial [Smittium angustum]